MTYPSTHDSPNAKKMDSHDEKSASAPTGTGDRDTFITEFREKLNKVETKISTMRDEGSRMAGDLKKKADDNLVRLDAKYKELKDKLDGIKNSTEENWKADKEVFQKSFQELSANFKGLFS